MTNNIRLQVNGVGQGAFLIRNGGEQWREMGNSVAGSRPTGYYTEALAKAEGKGPAINRPAAMGDLASAHGLKRIRFVPLYWHSSSAARQTMQRNEKRPAAKRSQNEKA